MHPPIKRRAVWKASAEAQQSHGHDVTLSCHFARNYRVPRVFYSGVQCEDCTTPCSDGGRMKRARILARQRTTWQRSPPRSGAVPTPSTATTTTLHNIHVTLPTAIVMFATPPNKRSASKVPHCRCKHQTNCLRCTHRCKGATGTMATSSYTNMASNPRQHQPHLSIGAPSSLAPGLLDPSRY